MDNEKVEQLAANNLTIPPDAIASLLQRLVRCAWCRTRNARMLPRTEPRD